MMSQAEIYNMQDYCMRRNHELDEREKSQSQRISLLGAVMLIMGAVISLMSLCLVIYVMWASVEMTGWLFIATGVAGIIGGITAMVLSRLVR